MEIFSTMEQAETTLGLTNPRTLKHPFFKGYDHKLGVLFQDTNGQWILKIKARASEKVAENGSRTYQLEIHCPVGGCSWQDGSMNFAIEPGDTLGEVMEANFIKGREQPRPKVLARYYRISQEIQAQLLFKTH